MGTYEQFQTAVLSKALPCAKGIYSALTGISPLIANEICHRASIDGDASLSSLNELEGLHLFKNFERLMDDIKNQQFQPVIIYKENEPIEFSSVELSCYASFEQKQYESISEVLESYYAMKDTITRIRQKSSDLRRVVSNALERSRKKYDLQSKQLKDTEKRDKYKVYGELITAYGYQLETGSKSLTCENYYTNE